MSETNLRCEMCGTPVDESDYQDDGYRHTDGRCTEYLKAALGAANRHAEGLAKLSSHLQSELDQQRGRTDAAEQKLTHIRGVLQNYNEDEFLSADRALGEIHGLVTS